MPDEVTVDLALSKKELERVQRVAKQKGLSINDAATLCFGAGLAKRVKRNTGKSPARIYSLKRKS